MGYVIWDATECDLPENLVGVDSFSRFRIIDGEVIAIEHYPWKLKRPIKAVRCAFDVFMWHVDMIRQNSWKFWNKERKY